MAFRHAIRQVSHRDVCATISSATPFAPCSTVMTSNGQRVQTNTGGRANAFDAGFQKRPGQPSMLSSFSPPSHGPFPHITSQRHRPMPRRAQVSLRRVSNFAGREPDPMLAVRRPADKADRLLRGDSAATIRLSDCNTNKAALGVSIVVCLR